MIKDERCKAGKLGKCENIKMGRYQDVQHDAFKLQKFAFGTYDFDDLYDVKKGQLEKRQELGRSARREANEISTPFHCRCSLFEMSEVFEMLKMYGTVRVVL